MLRTSCGLPVLVRTVCGPDRPGGCYDRALVHARPGAVLVTVLFDDERVDELPRELHDHPVTAVVTPSGGWQDLRPLRSS